MVIARLVLKCFFVIRHGSCTLIADRNSTCLIALYHDDLPEQILRMRRMFLSLIEANDMFRTIQTLISPVQHIDEIMTIRDHHIALAATSEMRESSAKRKKKRHCLTENIRDDNDVLCIDVLSFLTESSAGIRYN